MTEQTRNYFSFWTEKGKFCSRKNTQNYCKWHKLRSMTTKQRENKTLCVCTQTRCDTDDCAGCLIANMHVISKRYFRCFVFGTNCECVVYSVLFECGMVACSTAVWLFVRLTVSNRKKCYRLFVACQFLLF